MKVGQEIYTINALGEHLEQIAQCMGLHRLGPELAMDTETEQIQNQFSGKWKASLVQRETGRRVWWLLVSSSSLLLWRRIDNSRSARVGPECKCRTRLSQLRGNIRRYLRLPGEC